MKKISTCFKVFTSISISFSIIFEYSCKPCQDASVFATDSIITVSACFTLNVPEADSIFKSMTDEERILQLYILSDSKALVSDPIIPGGFLFSSNNLIELKKDVKAFRGRSKVKPICLFDADNSFDNFPASSKPEAASSCNDSAVAVICYRNFADTLKSCGINAVCGGVLNISDLNHENLSRICIAVNQYYFKGISAFVRYGGYSSSSSNQLIDSSLNTLINSGAAGADFSQNGGRKKGFNALSIYFLNDISSIDKALSADDEFVSGSISPSEFVAAVKKYFRHNKKAREKAYRKVLRILRVKYNKNFPCVTAESEDDFYTNERYVIENTAVCLSNKFNTIPLNNFADDDLMIIQIGGKKNTVFKDGILRYCNADYYFAKNNYESAHRHLLNISKKNVIILLCGKITDNNLAKLVSAVAINPKLCVLNFGFTSNLKTISAQSFLHLWANDSTAYEAASRMVCGGYGVSGFLSKPGIESKNIKINKCRLGYSSFKRSNLNELYLDSIDSLIHHAIDTGCFPGCQIFVACRGDVIFDKAYGKFTYQQKSKPVEPDDLYDIASCTKIASCVTAAIYLDGKGLLDINAPLGKCFKDLSIDWSNIPADTVPTVRIMSKAEFDTLAHKPPRNKVQILSRNRVTFVDTVLKREIPSQTVYDVPVKLLLEHRSGISPLMPLCNILKYKQTYCKLLRNQGGDPDKLKPEELSKKAFDYFFCEQYTKGVAERRVNEGVWLRNFFADSIETNTKRLPVSKDKKYKYSDVNMVLLQRAEDTLLGCGTDYYLYNNFYKPLGMRKTCYKPSELFSKENIVPTAPGLWTGKILQGDVHDPTAALLGGISGNAGLFSCARDLCVLFQMILDGGVYGNRKYLEKSSIDKFTTRVKGTTRALGFDITPSAYASDSASEFTYGHTGFTGACVWVDPESRLIIVFLCNRVHPVERNNMINRLRIRKKLCNYFYAAIR